MKNRDSNAGDPNFVYYKYRERTSRRRNTRRQLLVALRAKPAEDAKLDKLWTPRSLICIGKTFPRGPWILSRLPSGRIFPDVFSHAAGQQ